MVKKIHKKIKKIITEKSCGIKNGTIIHPQGTLKIPKGLCLELGCGNFNFESEYQTKVIGIDQEKLSKSKNFIHGDLRNINVWSQLENNSFDLITSIVTLHWIKNIDFIFDQCYQKLTPTGKIFYCLWHENNFKYPLFELLTDFIPVTKKSEMCKTNIEQFKELAVTAKFKIVDIFSFKTKFYINEITEIEEINAEYRPRAEFIVLIAEKNLTPI